MKIINKQETSSLETQLGLSIPKRFLVLLHDTFDTINTRGDILIHHYIIKS